MFTTYVVFFSTKCLSSNDYPVCKGNKYSQCLSEILNLKISKSLSETHNFNKENMLSVFVDENVFEFQRGHGSETHVMNLMIKWTKHKINILYLCCKFVQISPPLSPNTIYNIEYLVCFGNAEANSFRIFQLSEKSTFLSLFDAIFFVPEKKVGNIFHFF